MDKVNAPDQDYIPSPLSYRSPGLAFKILFQGPDSDSANNYQRSLLSSRFFELPVQKHNFDQFRFAWKGNFNIGPHATMQEGDLCYHPEGVPYGPLKDDGNERIPLLFSVRQCVWQGVLEQGHLGKTIGYVFGALYRCTAVQIGTSG